MVGVFVLARGAGELVDDSVDVTDPGFGGVARATGGDAIDAGSGAFVFEGGLSCGAAFL